MSGAQTDKERQKIEFKIVEPYPTPEPWLYDAEGNVIGIAFREEISREEFERRYPKGEADGDG